VDPHHAVYVLERNRLYFSESHRDSTIALRVEIWHTVTGLWYHSKLWKFLHPYALPEYVFRTPWRVREWNNHIWRRPRGVTHCATSAIRCVDALLVVSDAAARRLELWHHDGVDKGGPDGGDYIYHDDRDRGLRRRHRVHLELDWFPWLKHLETEGILKVTVESDLTQTSHGVGPKAWHCVLQQVFVFRWMWKCYQSYDRDHDLDWRHGRELHLLHLALIPWQLGRDQFGDLKRWPWRLV